jgi:hypothetical protein
MIQTQLEIVYHKQPTGRSQQENSAEIDRRVTELNEIAEKHKKLITSIFKSYEMVLVLIKKIEKSTLVSDSSRHAARYLFYAATDQHNLTNAANTVLQSFNVTPALGDKPSISSATFNAFMDLINLINLRNQVISTYLEDLEVILHNDLVRSIYGKAKNGAIPVQHMTSGGLTDNRVKDSLI